MLLSSISFNYHCLPCTAPLPKLKTVKLVYELLNTGIHTNINVFLAWKSVGALKLDVVAVYTCSCIQQCKDHTETSGQYGTAYAASYYTFANFCTHTKGTWTVVFEIETEKGNIDLIVDYRQSCCKQMMDKVGLLKYNYYPYLYKQWAGSQSGHSGRLMTRSWP